MTAYLERMPAGIPGDVTRKGNAVLEPNMMGAAALPFGAVIQLTGGKVAAIAAGGTVYGFLVRPYPMQSTETAMGAGAMPANASCDVMRSGYMAVTLKSGTPAKGAQVHVRVVAGAGRVVGDLEAAADGTDTMAVPGCFFMGAPDANGITEIAYNV